MTGNDRAKADHPLRYFDDDDRETIAAAMARIIPTDDHPGAREAGTIDFLERYLSGIDFVYARPDGSGFETLTGKRADAWRTRIEVVRQKYRSGIAEMNRLSHELHGLPFTRLSEGEQDVVLHALEQPKQTQAPGGGSIAAVPDLASPELGLQQIAAESDLDFFPLLVLHTRQGFLSDPVYGGNRDRVGWKTIGFPGPETMAEAHAGHYSTLPYFAETEERTSEGSGI